MDTHTDIAYTVSTKRGPVKSRDFVVLRHRAAVGTSFVIASVSIETPLVPEDKQYVRFVKTIYILYLLTIFIVFNFLLLNFKFVLFYIVIIFLLV